MVPPPEVAGSHTTVEGVFKVSYSGILNGLPQELRGKITPPSSAKFSIPASLVLEQLPKGAVKIPFGELRKAAPVGIFKNSSDHDARWVDLPLREILPQVTPEAYSRRTQQQRQEVPEEITDLFGQKGELLAHLRVLKKDEIAKPLAAPSASKPTEDTPTGPSLSAPEEEPSPIPISPMPTPTPAAKAKAATPKPVAPVVKAAATASKPAPSPLPTSTPRSIGAKESLTVPLGELSKFWPEAINEEIVALGLEGADCVLSLTQLGKSVQNGAVQLTWSQLRAWIRPQPEEDAPSPYADTVIEIPLKFIASLTLAQGRASTPAVAKKASPAPKPAVKEAKSEPAPRSTPAAPVAPKGAPSMTTMTAKPAMVMGPGGKQLLRVPLSLLWTDWPEELREELAASEYANSILELPRETVEPGLKSGKVEFLWKQLQEFLKPPCNGVLAASFFETALPLPLGVVVPLLFNKTGGAAPKRAHAADEIPDVFNPAGKAQEAPAAAEPAPAPVAVQPPELPATPAPAEAPKKEPKDLAELFGEPEKRNWTPNEIVHQTTQLPDVRGALIALQDGLLVASCMPPEWKTETIAAFLPQIFGRMNQYAKELKMGDLNSVSFTVEQGTLQIYNAGIIYFAALGQAGQPLPNSLNLIARELSRHTR